MCCTELVFGKSSSYKDEDGSKLMANNSNVVSCIALDAYKSCIDGHVL